MVEGARLEIDSGYAYQGISADAKALAIKHFPPERSSSVCVGKPRCPTGVLGPALHSFYTILDSTCWRTPWCRSVCVCTRSLAGLPTRGRWPCRAHCCASCRRGAGRTFTSLCPSCAAKDCTAPSITTALAAMIILFTTPSNPSPTASRRVAGQQEHPHVNRRGSRHVCRHERVRLRSRATHAACLPEERAPAEDDIDIARPRRRRPVDEVHALPIWRHVVLGAPVS